MPHQKNAKIPTVSTIKRSICCKFITRYWYWLKGAMAIEKVCQLMIPFSWKISKFQLGTHLERTRPLTIEMLLRAMIGNTQEL